MGIAWDKHPDSEFDMRNGEKMTYMKYYSQRYNKSIQDAKQPLLISMPKMADQRAGQTGPIYLVPELCFMTGLSEEQRANFQLMKVSNRINTHPDIKKELDAWNLEFSNNLETFK